MKKYTLVILLSGLTALSSVSQSKLNPQGQIIVDRYKAERVIDVMSAGEETPQTQTAIVRLAPGYTSKTLSDMGFTINTDLGEIVTVAVTLDRIGELEASDAVKSISLGGKESPMMNFARTSAAVDMVQEGFSYGGETMSFDGSGVIAGMMDTGFEANHVNFTDAAGNSRVVSLWHFTGSNGNNSVRRYDSSNISRFSSDTNTQSHATHVAGIMAGSYDRQSRYVNMSSPSSGNGKVTEGANPFYGVATGSDIAASVGSLTHANIIDGVANIVSYAEQSGKPCVVNLSLGSTYGPHDGTDDYTEALSLLGKRAVIVMAAGNDGENNLSISKTLSAADNQIKTLIAENKASGIVDVWSGDATPLNVTWAIYDQDKQQLVTLGSSADGARVVINSQNSAFAASFSGSIEMASGVDPNNNRYNAFSVCSVEPKAGNVTKLLALVVEGAAGTRVNVFGNDVTFQNPYWVGWTGGSTANTINNSCCGENIISVGAYTTRTSWSTLAQNGSMYYPGNTIDAICPFSSYGESFQGKALPMVAAPGSAIISSYNYDYVKTYGAESSMIASAQGLIYTDYWGQMQGTSMACPMVSGIVALWLEADPTLGFDDVAEIIASTSVTDRFTRRAPERFGAGKIDALAGIKMVLDEKASVGAVFEDDVRNFILTPVDGGYNVYVAGESALTVTVYDMAGRAVAAVSADGNSVDVDTSSLRPGVYIVAAQGKTQRHTAKIEVR